MRILAVVGLLVVLIVIGLLVAFIISMARDPESTSRGAAARRSHRDMARWIDRVLDDEMIRPLLPAEVQEIGRELLDRYYARET